jgi:hypothetical protein
LCRSPPGSRVGEREAPADVGELHLAVSARAVAVVVQRARDVVVDDAVVGILRGGADHELAGRDVAEPEVAREDRLLQQDGVVGDVEVGDAVDIGGGIKRGVEQEPVLPAEPGELVAPVSAIDDVIPVAAPDRAW